MVASSKQERKETKNKGKIQKKSIGERKKREKHDRQESEFREKKRKRNLKQIIGGLRQSGLVTGKSCLRRRGTKVAKEEELCVDAAEKEKENIRAEFAHEREELLFRS